MRPRRRSTIGPNKKRTVVRRAVRKNRLSLLAPKPVSRDVVVSAARERTAGLRRRIEPGREGLEARLDALRRRGFPRREGEKRGQDFEDLPMRARPVKYQVQADLNME